jgi:Ca2+-binding EF-hand superfamily protein
MKCGHGRSVITVFSAAAYPADQGSNQGAVLVLQPDGTYEHTQYSLGRCSETSKYVKRKTVEQALIKVRSMISCHRSKLEKAFAEVQTKDGKVTLDQWVWVMSDTIGMSDMPWKTLQPHVAPKTLTEGGVMMIPVQEFLRLYSLRAHDSDIHRHDAETLAENREMLLTVFRFLDANGDGTLSEKEFRAGLDLLNRRLPETRRLKDPDNLFKKLDDDGDGEIGFEEFMSGFGIA